MTFRYIFVERLNSDFQNFKSNLFQNCLRQVNPYISNFLQIAELAESTNPIQNLTFVINPDEKPRMEHARVHGLNLHEIAVLTNEKPAPSDIVVQSRSGQITTISDTNRAFDPLHFVLLFPYGSCGWSLKIRQS